MDPTNPLSKPRGQRIDISAHTAVKDRFAIRNALKNLPNARGKNHPWNIGLFILSPIITYFLITMFA